MTTTYTCFDGFRRLASGTLKDVAPVLQHAHTHPEPGPVLLFDDATGRTIDIDTRGSEHALLARLTATPAPADATESTAGGAASVPSGPVAAAPPRGRGRPRLGVVAREVTLLPRHWDWLAAQPGGASVVLRKLVELARRTDKDDTRGRHERAYHFMSALAGDLPGFEEAIRALFADDQAGVAEQVAAWPEDVRAHALQLAFGDGARRRGAGAGDRPDAGATESGAAP